MKASQEIKDFTKKFEGLRLSPYLDSAGVPTIGYGSTLYPNGVKVTMKDKSITTQEAERIFNWHYSLFENDVKLLLGADILYLGQINNSNKFIISPLIAQNRFDALVDFAYNVGSDIDADNIPEGLGDSNLLKKVLSNPTDVTIRNEFMKWNHAGGKVSDGLTRRRKAEADWYFKFV